jgi:hypothetical protein
MAGNLKRLFVAHPAFLDQLEQGLVKKVCVS